VRVVLLGTGSADGWPNPFCACASCSRVRGTPDVRGQTAALVDGRLLLDCGPEAPRAAARLGVPLDGVRWVLLSHAHPDHVGPAALLWRRWAHPGARLEVAGPAAALELCRDWVGPDDPVVFRPVSAGTSLQVGPYLARALPAAHDGETLLWELAGPGGTRLLYATDTGPLPPPAVWMAAGAAYGLVLLEETFGTATEHGTGHLDLSTFPLALAELRRVRAVVDGTRVIAVHLGHRNPPPDELAALLARWGAEVLPDGASLTLPGQSAESGPRIGSASPTGSASPAQSAPAADGETADSAAGRPALVGAASEAAGGAAPARTAHRAESLGAGRSTGPWRTLVLGGARSGKSTWAEASLRAFPSVTYVATAPRHPDDPEWTERVAQHRARRPAAWRTLETADVASALSSADGPVLIDDVGNWLTVALDRAGAWSDPSTLPDVRAATDELVAAWRAVRVPVVAVTNEVGSGVVPPTTAGRLFRDELGRLNARLAAESDEVVLLVAGMPVPLRPGPRSAASARATGEGDL
jgi:adenosylcobinamide kinase / adenosylcobinamide-phosphate guanylyltransferase